MISSRYFIVLCFLLTASLFSRAAYPTSGGEGGKVITVTSLADSGPGSLREALSASEPRIIRFAISGEIRLNDVLRINKPFVTVDGESAPSPGITLMGDTVRIRTHDVIMRHLRVRVGMLPNGSDPQNRDGIQIDGAQNGSDPGYNVLVENCSVSWAIDENIQCWGRNNHDVVIRNCIIAEGLMKGHPKGGTHSAGMIIGPGTRNITVQGNLLAHNAFRNPVFASACGYVVNNLIYNPGFNGIHVYGGIEKATGDFTADKVLVSIIANKVIAGTNTRPSLGMFHQFGLNPGSQLYLADNLAIGTKTFNKESVPPKWTGASPFVSTPPISLPGWMKVLHVSEVESSVLSNAGARPNDRDEVDNRIVSDVKNRTGAHKDYPTDPRLGPQKAIAATGIVGEYGALLRKYVTPNGVRYAAWKKDSADLATLDRVVDEFAAQKDGDLAFYLNAYNAWMLHEVLKEYPIKVPNETMLKIFEANRIKVAGQETNFNALEKEIVTRFRDPRTIFALSRASRSGPDLSSEPFLAQTVKMQLDQLSGLFINSSKGVDMRPSEVAISRVFGWKEHQTSETQVTMINRYRHLMIPAGRKIVFQEYDWSLNESQ